MQKDSNNILYVTAFFDLHKREQGKRHTDTKIKPPEEYIQLANDWLFQQPISLLVFTDPEFVAPIEKLRASAKASITVVPWALEDSPFFDLRAPMESIMKTYAISNSNPIKDTFWYYLIGWTKSYLLQFVNIKIAESYTHVAWIDFGLKHVLNPAPRSEWYTTVREKASANQIDLLSLNPMTSTEMKLHKSSKADYYRTRRYKVGGGFWLVPRGMLIRFYDMFRTYIRHLVNYHQVVSCEDEILGALSHMRSYAGLFRFHYGDYVDILHFDLPRSQASFGLMMRGIQTLLREPKMTIRNLVTLMDMGRCLGSVAAFVPGLGECREHIRQLVQQNFLYLL